MARVLVLGKTERGVSSIAASVAGFSHFVTRAWSPETLANAVSAGSPDLVIMDLRSGELSLAEAKELAESYDRVSEAVRFAVVDSIDSPDLCSKYISDFIVCPYDLGELELRLTRLLSRAHRMKSGKLLTANGLVIDTESFEVAVDGRPLTLTFKEFELLRFLAAHPSRVHTREALLNQVWGYEYFGGLRTVDVHVRRIRAKLGPRHEHLIQTVRGVGYRFVSRTRAT